MNPVLKKLQYKGQDPVLIAGHSEGYKEIIRGLTAKVQYKPQGKYEFIQFFAQMKEELDKELGRIVDALKEDGILWICYPKTSSKKIKSDLNRDRVRDIVRQYHFEGVSLVSLDDDWSALRIRHIDTIKKLKAKS